MPGCAKAERAESLENLGIFVETGREPQRVCKLSPQSLDVQARIIAAEQRAQQPERTGQEREQTQRRQGEAVSRLGAEGKDEATKKAVKQGCAEPK